MGIDMASKRVLRVVDERGTVYTLERKLGEGGQGAVFRVAGGRVAVKLYRVPPSAGAVARERLSAKLRQVRHLPIDDLPIARPLAMLAEPAVGYVMERLTGMVPFARMTDHPPDGVTAWYLETGGVRRRLSLLARMAVALQGLHSRGLVFGDLSPNNVFLSEDHTGEEVCFIDADNLCFESQPSRNAVYTPFYGAPEVVAGRSGVNTLTDVHAFAVMAFETLSLVHPFIGDWVSEGEPELEEAAVRGELPWVDDPGDDRNAASQGIPRDIVVSPLLMDLFQATFGPGRTRPTARPGVEAWPERLQTAADATVHCPECGGTFYASRSACPWCDRPRPSMVLARIRHWNADRREFVPIPGTRTTRGLKRPSPLLVVDEAGPRPLTRHHTHVGGRMSREAQVDLALVGRRLTVRARSEAARSWYLVSPDGGLHRLDTGEWVLDVQGPPWWDLHCGLTQENHRVVTFTHVPETP